MEEKMSYKEQYGRVFEIYKAEVNEYEALTNAQRYHEILASMPFEFLNAVQLCEKLSLYEKLDVKPQMSFSSLDEAKVFYRNLITFNKKTEKLLEDASHIVEIGDLAKRINGLVSESPYLGSNLYVFPNNDIISLAERCLREIPRFPQILTKKFRWNYIESVIRCLSQEDLQELVASKVIKSADIDNISLTEKQSDYRSKVWYLCKVLDRPKPIIASYKQKLKGVTFPNDDGSSRQENLTALKTYTEEHPNQVVTLSVERYTYTPEIGDPEPAIKIAWEGKVIGNIAKDVVEDILEKYKNPQFTATLEKVSGGDNGINFGCAIHLNVIAPGYTDITTEKEQNAEER